LILKRRAVSLTFFVKFQPSFHNLWSRGSTPPSFLSAEQNEFITFYQEARFPHFSAFLLQDLATTGQDNGSFEVGTLNLPFGSDTTPPSVLTGLRVRRP
jgi:hypothetical protein